MRALYITYTGLSENLGKSQILPYICGLAKWGVEFDVVSFENEADLERRISEVRNEVAGLPISCYFINRQDKSSIWKRVFAIAGAMKLAVRLARKRRHDLVHCRNAFAAECALAALWLTGTPYLLDMRGFWGDARKETGQWDPETFKGRLLYMLWKWRERTYLRKSAITNCLTEKARNWIISMGYKRDSEVIVTPCCVDFDAVDEVLEKRSSGRDPEAFTCIYLGSLGGVYDDLRIFTTFHSIRMEVPRAKLLFIGDSDPAELISLSEEAGVKLHRSEFDVVRATNHDVFKFLDAADVGISFCNPGFYASGVSSTKIGEYLAVGLPVICNESIGDVMTLLERTSGGLILSDSVLRDVEDSMIRRFVRGLNLLDRDNIKRKARMQLDMRFALANYFDAYRRISSREKADG